tara:strand:- start:353 stop:790 length:438 start_codon:yes stop_codon:yes gene_type:complete
MPKGVYVRTKTNPNQGVNRYGIKLENFDSYKDYRKAYRKIYLKEFGSTKEGKLTKAKYDSKYNKTENGRSVRKFLEAKRRVVKLQRTVFWADLKAIKEFYTNCPKGYHVDHIVPLQGTNVSGLHVLNNLQYLTKSQNLSKGNKWI